MKIIYFDSYFFGGSEESRRMAGLLEGAVLLERRKEMQYFA
jgi:hypothetical protein